MAIINEINIDRRFHLFMDIDDLQCQIDETKIDSKYESIVLLKGACATCLTWDMEDVEFFKALGEDPNDPSQNGGSDDE